MPKSPKNTVLTVPFTTATAEAYWKKHRGKKPFLTGVVSVDLDHFIRYTHEAAMDILSERLVGNDLLMDIAYVVVGHRGNNLHVQVTGDASGALLRGDEGDGENGAAKVVPVPSLAARVQALPGFEEGALDDVVHEAASRTASGVNNGGVEEQVDYLLAQGYSESDILSAAKAS